METTRLTSKGQLVIPKAVRDRLHVAAGTQFAVSTTGRKIVLEAVSLKAHRLGDWPGFKRPVKKLGDKKAFAPVELDEDK